MRYLSFNGLGREPSSSEDEKLAGMQKLQDLNQITQSFLLRRTASVVEKYLGSKTELVLFCRPSEKQIDAYHHFIEEHKLNSDISESKGESVLGSILMLRKLCNSLSLLNASMSTKDALSLNDSSGITLHITILIFCKNVLLGKMSVLFSLLEWIKTNTVEKVAVTSNFTETLDEIQLHASQYGYSICRLDGKTAQDKRQRIVDSFNASANTSPFIMLLSTKAGGIGLNLVGASRMILYDMDWNPSICSQGII